MEAILEDSPGPIAAVAESRISLSLTATYAPSWGLWEGIREMVQNWHDGLLEASTASAEKIDPGAPVKAGNLRISAEHEGHFDFIAKSDGIGSTLCCTLGSCRYNTVLRQLLLVNRNVGIQRKSLLLGFSKKAMHSDVIGAFGEGMKVGALALLRRGLRFAILTRGEIWNFTLAVDPSFGERVLSVDISARKSLASDEARRDEATTAVHWLPADLGGSELGPDDTLTVVGNLDAEEWQRLAPRFLFLCPPAEHFGTTQGRLLLDEHLAGQLFVKGIWISDLSDDRLTTGADFFDMRLDRDRVAALRRSDIDHQISSMWSRAVVMRPELLPRYYELLAAENASSDVSFAELYCDDDASAAVALEFLRVHGNDAVPVTARDANTSRQKLQHLEQTLGMATVICSNALISVLRKSGRLNMDVDALIDESVSQAKRYVLPSSLDDVERSALAHGCLLVSTADPAHPLEPSSVDVVEFVSSVQSTTNDRRCWLADPDVAEGRRIEVLRGTLNRSEVHAGLPDGHCFTPKLGDSCRCCQAELARSLLAVWSPSCENASRCLVAALSAQSSHLAPPACVEAYIAPGSARWGKAIEKLAEGREAGLRARIIALEGALGEERRSRLKEVGTLQKHLRALEKEFAATEFKTMDLRICVEAEVKAEWESKVAKTQVECDTLRFSASEAAQHFAAERTRSEKDLAFLQNRVRAVEAELSTQVEADDRRAAEAGRRARALQERLARRHEQLLAVVRQVDVGESHSPPQQKSSRSASAAASASAEERENDDVETVVSAGQASSSLLAALNPILKQLRDEQASKSLCCVCLDLPPNTVVMPCRHKHLCQCCADNLTHCPLCRVPIQQRIELFES